MSQRLTGNATSPAMTSDAPRLAQKSRSVSPALIAPGIARTKALSTISMTTIEIVSAANAIRSASRMTMPDPSTDRTVSPYPKTNARATASAIDGTSCQPSWVAITSPRTSPIPQPVRQWTVA
jgi:hypothetical protein